MPGYVNYFYKDGNLPTHTKSGFRQHGVLTVHGIITKNVLIFMHKLNNFPNVLPPSVRETIGANAPIRGACSDHETCKDWLEIFGTISLTNRSPIKVLCCMLTQCGINL